MSENPPPVSDQRKSKRREIDFGALALSPEGSVITACRVIDISDGGARLVLERATGMPDLFTLVPSPDAKTRDCRIKWKNGKECGVEFTGRLTR